MIDRYQALSKEIVHFIQYNGDHTDECIKFVEYELRLRFVSKDDLSKLAIQKDINDTVQDYSVQVNK